MNWQYVLQSCDGQLANVHRAQCISATWLYWRFRLIAFLVCASSLVVSPSQRCLQTVERLLFTRCLLAGGRGPKTLSPDPVWQFWLRCVRYHGVLVPATAFPVCPWGSPDEKHHSVTSNECKAGLWLLQGLGGSGISHDTVIRSCVAVLDTLGQRPWRLPDGQWSPAMPLGKP